MQKPPFYGLDSPIVIGLFFVLGVGMTIIGLFSYIITTPFFSWFLFLEGVISAIICFSLVVWMGYGSLIAKPRLIKEMLDWLDLKGEEDVLDIGTGRGQMMIETAKRLPRGRVFGVDHWYAQDQSTNSLYQTYENANAEGVKDRIDLQVADLHELPFPSNSFDAVVSCLAIHKIHKDREKALTEILRVLKPGGEFILLDWGNNRHIHRFFNKTPASDATVSSMLYRCFPPVSIVRGEKKNVIEV